MKLQKIIQMWLNIGIYSMYMKSTDWSILTVLYWLCLIIFRSLCVRKTARVIFSVQITDNYHIQNTIRFFFAVSPFLVVIFSVKREHFSNDFWLLNYVHLEEKDETTIKFVETISIPDCFAIPKCVIIAHYLYKCTAEPVGSWSMVSIK